MSASSPTVQKVVVRKASTVVASTPDVLDRHFLIDMRRALLQQLSVIERHLQIQRCCRQCGSSDLSTK